MRSFSLLPGLLLITLLAACGDRGGEEGEAGGGEALQIAVIPKSVGFDFWSTVKAGADAAGQELGNVEVLWRGTSDESDIAGQISLVEAFINQQVDAVVIAAADTRGLVPVLRQAEQAGIPVITIDSDTDPQVSRAFIATNNREAAAKAADLVADRTGGTGTVALIPYIPGASTSIEREQGFKEGLARHPGLQLVATQYSQSDYERAMRVTEDILTANPDLDAIFAANEVGTLGVLQALQSRGLAGKVVLVGFDASPRQIEAVRAGTVHGLIVQDPFKMGYEGVMQAVKVINQDSVQQRMDSGSMVVTKDNLDAFLEEDQARRQVTASAE